MTESFAQLFEQSLASQRIRPGQILSGLVVDVGDDMVIVNVGLKSEAVIPVEQFKNERGEIEVKAGDMVEVALDSVEDGTGETRLSREKAKRARTWTRLEDAFSKAEIVVGIITGRVKGGFTVEIEHVRAFLPGSLVDVRPVRDTAYLENKPLEFKVIKLDQKRNNVVVSRRAVVEQEFSAERTALMDNLQEGAVVRGSVKNLTDYGAFVDLGGIDGLIHKSEISWSKVANPESGYNVGDSVDAEVIDINTERGRISLSIRKLQPDPWNAAIADIKIGDFVEGTITKLVNFGAFVRVRDGLEGLIHISELSHNRVTHPGDVVKDEQTLKLKVISLDSERHRLGLSLKQAEETPVRETPAAEPKRETRRARPERSFSMDDAVQEPEGGIDTTLAAAFAGIREKIAETADDAAGSDGETKKKRAPKKADDGESATEAIEEALADAAPEAPADQA